MAIEPSVISDDKIKMILSENYGIDNINSIDVIDKGTDYCRRIVCDDNIYFLEEFPSQYKIESVNEEAKLNQFSGNNEMTVANFMPTKDNKYVWIYNDRGFHLRQFITGNTFKRNTAPTWFLDETGMILGKIHKFLLNYPRLNDGIGPGFYNSWNLESTLESYTKFNDLVSELKDHTIKV